MVGNPRFNTLDNSNSSALNERKRRVQAVAIISEYEERYGVTLTEAELNAIIEDAFTGSDIVSEDTRREVGDRVRDIKNKKGKPSSNIRGSVPRQRSD